MYKIKGSHAYSHGCYIRPGEYTDLWKLITRHAKESEISISEYVSHCMYIFYYGNKAKYSKMNKRKK
jgi:hypothetical protein